MIPRFRLVVLAAAGFAARTVRAEDAGRTSMSFVREDDDPEREGRTIWDIGNPGLEERAKTRSRAYGC